MSTKVFVGNLSFKTKANELASEFTAAGKVVSANIITRGPRSLGYGFVELESADEAAKAVSILNKRSVDGREINVELAKPRDETRIAERRQRGGGRPRGGGGRGRGGSGGRGRGGFDHNNAPPPAQSGDINNNNNPDSGSQSRGRGFRPRRFRPRGPPNSNNAPQSNTPGGDNANRPPRNLDNSNRRRGPPRPPRDLSNRTPSSTTLFVANLPFALDDAGLSGLFKDLKVSKAHVVKNRNGRSKGFGFVEFDNEADQRAALTAAEKLVADQRELIVKIALTAPEGQHKDAPPAASTSDSSTKETPKADVPKTN